MRLTTRSLPVVAQSLLVWLVATLAVFTAGAAQTTTPAPARASTFAADVAALSEGEGYFDTDNLISNEQRYLSVVPELKAGAHGGAYVGVGPDQNFSYIVAVRPAIAIITDIRRDNLLLHLLFKALFAESRTRVDYLALLTGRPTPADADAWRGRSIDELVSYADAAPRLTAPALQASRGRLSTVIKAFGLPLSAEDLATIERFHSRFIDAGLGLQFQSTGRPPQAGYPTFRQLLLATDDEGHRVNYLATEDGFQFLKSLQARDLVIPIVGDLSGPKALKAVGAMLKRRGESLSAFYASNVEYYLFRDGSFARFIDNLRALPVAPNATIVRSVFSGGGNSYNLTQRVPELVAGYGRGLYHQYGDLTR